MHENTPKVIRKTPNPKHPIHYFWPRLRPTCLLLRVT